MIKFERHPEIALNRSEWLTGQFKAMYANDYLEGFKRVKERVWGEKAFLRSLFANDLWFLVNYGFGITDKESWNGEKAHHPFVVNMCKAVQEGPRTDTLDIWARFHWKQFTNRHPHWISASLIKTKTLFAN